MSSDFCTLLAKVYEQRELSRLVIDEVSYSYYSGACIAWSADAFEGPLHFCQLIPLFSGAC